MSNRGKARALKIEEHVEFKKLLSSSDANALAIWNQFSKTHNEDDFNRSVIDILSKQVLTSPKDARNNNTKSKPSNDNSKQTGNGNNNNNNLKSKAKDDDKANSAENLDHKKAKEESKKILGEKETSASLNSLTQLLKSTMISSTIVKESPQLSAVDVVKNDNNPAINSEIVGFGLWNSVEKSLSSSEINNNISGLSGQGLGLSFNSIGGNHQESLDDHLILSEKSINHWDVAQELMGNLTPHRHERNVIPENNNLSSHAPHGFPLHQPQHGFPQHHSGGLGNPMFFPPMGMLPEPHMMLPSHHGPTHGGPFGGGPMFPPMQTPMHPHMFSPNYSHFPQMHPGQNFHNFPQMHPGQDPQNIPVVNDRSIIIGNDRNTPIGNDRNIPVGNDNIIIGSDRLPERNNRNFLLESFIYDDKKVGIDLNQNLFSHDLKPSTTIVIERPVPTTEKSNTQDTAVPVASKGPQFRTTRNQCARLSISMNQQGRRDHDIICTENNNSVRPGWHMTVHWEIPLKELQKTDTDFVIALLRLGSPTNASSIVSKKIDTNSKTSVAVDNQGVQVVRGKLPFHAPKSAGVFVYRLFDQSTKDRLLVTMGTSIAFKVDLLDIDVSTSFKFCIDLFQEKSYQRAISQLRTTIVGMRNTGRALNGESPNSLLSKCVDYMVEASIQAMQSLEVAKSKATNDVITTESAEEKAKDDDAWVTVRQAGKLQKDIYDTFCSIRYNDISWMMLGEIYQLRILRTQELYCPLLNRYFFTPQARDECRQSEFNFIPALCSSRNQLQEKLSLGSLEKAIHDILPSLLPSPDFHIRRENARMRVQKAICSSGVVPENTELVLYGSSRNNFGTDSADLDMCMIFPPNVNVAIIDRPALIERLAETLGKIGMTEVSARATARIPIVQFKDPQTGFECDISFNNPLAVANTKLLKTYSEIDSRVLPLAFVIKHWAKARLINSPGDGTLSSYGYILCLIHYLQHRPVPVLPNLQQLPPDWDGNPNFRKEYPNAKWNRTVESHPVDGAPCDTYFYNPRSKDLLRSFAARNRESAAELLAGFFQYFAWEFDYRRSVISIQTVDPIDKLTKAETDCWNQHDRISIEDPFETWYDVAHVVKSAQMFFIRKEFLRAHTLISRCASHGPFDSLPSSVDPVGLLGKICERSEEREKPPAVADQKDDNEDDL